MTSSHRAAFACVGGLVLALALGAGAKAQSDQDRRLDRLEKEIRELRAIVFQGRDTGQPVVVKPAGPDPAVEALSSRADQVDQTLRTLSGQVEVLQHDLDEARRQTAAAHDAETELRGEVKILSDQVAKLQAPPAPDPSAVAPSQAPPPPPPAVNEGAAFRAAKAELDTGDYAAGGDALTRYLQNFPTGAHARDAQYYLAESLYGRGQYNDATVAYARALKDWPKTAWAPDAVLKLAKSLAATSRSPQACAAIAEFKTRYEKKATKTERARAAVLETSAQCSP